MAHSGAVMCWQHVQSVTYLSYSPIADDTMYAWVSDGTGVLKGNTDVVHLITAFYFSEKHISKHGLGYVHHKWKLITFVNISFYFFMNLTSLVVHLENKCLCWIMPTRSQRADISIYCFNVMLSPVEKSGTSTLHLCCLQESILEQLSLTSIWHCKSHYVNIIDLGCI